MSALVSRRFDGWVSANVDLAAVAGPLRRWRPHPSNPLMRRRARKPSPLTSANRRLTEPRETPAHYCHGRRLNARDPTRKNTMATGHGQPLHRSQHERPPAAVAPSVAPVTLT